VSTTAVGGRRSPMANDFLIGAHVLSMADRLLTPDRGFYRRYFAGLKGGERRELASDTGGSETAPLKVVSPFSVLCRRGRVTMRPG
jgi:hypothetical protein